ncbi:MAG TPA: AsmA-like C-terminal region-containing protein, partial [Gammaproteobacteria bacterium]|nr:AsmA-like C-terminal region-containing protein [Gammaproteobacteria bacterium]
NEALLSSDLQGLAIDLPAPFGKSALSKRAFLLKAAFQQGGGSGFKTQLSYGDLISAKLNIRQQQTLRLIEIDSRQVKGLIKLSYPFDAKQAIQASLDRLVINTGNAQTLASLDPQTVPPLIISSKQFIYGNKNMGQLSLTTLPKTKGMLIQHFNLKAPEYNFESTGQWTGSGQAQQSQLQGTLESSKVNTLLARLGLPLRSLLVDKGNAAFSLQWKGAPYNFSVASLGGGFSFVLEKGRVINLNEADNTKVDMGRMLSLFSLQTIPRRLSLDFSDLFEKGYSFDSMRGDFSLKQGSAFTRKPAVFDGPVARITASGRIGLLAQDYDLILSISPYVTDSLPVVAGALTLNPFVGAAAWLVNKAVLSKSVAKVATYNYKVTGSWDTPVWKSVPSS